MSISCRVNYTWHFHSTLAFSPRSRQTHRSLCWKLIHLQMLFIEADKQEIVDVIKSTARFVLHMPITSIMQLSRLPMKLRRSVTSLTAISGVSAFISALSASMMLRCNPNSPSCPTENSLFPTSLFSGFSSFLDIQI